MGLCGSATGSTKGGHLAVENLADALERLLAEPLVFLPEGEMTKRILRLRARGR